MLPERAKACSGSFQSPYIAQARCASARLGLMTYYRGGSL